MDVLRRNACLVVGPVGVGGLLASLVARRCVGPRSGWRCRVGLDLVVAWAVGGWRLFRVVLGRACRVLAGGFLLLRVSGVHISVGPHVRFVLGFVLIFVFPGWCDCGLGVFRGGRRLGVWGPERSWGPGLVGRGCWPPTVISLLAVPRRHFCFVSSKVLFIVFLARLIAVVSTVSTCLVFNSSIFATCPPIPAARVAFSLCFIRFDFLVRSCCIW